MPPPKLKFTVGENLLCVHGPTLYEARCIGHEWTNQKVALYLVHYMGWKRSHDEWVEDTRLFKRTEDNLERKAELEQAALHEMLQRKKHRKRGRIVKRVLELPKVSPPEDPPAAVAKVHPKRRRIGKRVLKVPKVSPPEDPPAANVEDIVTPTLPVDTATVTPTAAATATPTATATVKDVRERRSRKGDSQDGAVPTSTT